MPPPISVYENVRSLERFIVSYRVRTANHGFLCLVSSVLSARRDFQSAGMSERHACMHACMHAGRGGEMNEHSSDAVQNLVGSDHGPHDSGVGGGDREF